MLLATVRVFEFKKGRKIVLSSFRSDGTITLRDNTVYLHLRNAPEQAIGSVTKDLSVYSLDNSVPLTKTVIENIRRSLVFLQTVCIDNPVPTNLNTRWVYWNGETYIVSRDQPKNHVAIPCIHTPYGSGQYLQHSLTPNARPVLCPRFGNEGDIKTNCGLVPSVFTRVLPIRTEPDACRDINGEARRLVFKNKHNDIRTIDDLDNDEEIARCIESNGVVWCFASHEKYILAVEQLIKDSGLFDNKPTHFINTVSTIDGKVSIPIGYYAEPDALVVILKSLSVAGVVAVIRIEPHFGDKDPVLYNVGSLSTRSPLIGLYRPELTLTRYTDHPLNLTTLSTLMGNTPIVMDDEQPDRLVKMTVVKNSYTHVGVNVDRAETQVWFYGTEHRDAMLCAFILTDQLRHGPDGVRFGSHSTRLFKAFVEWIERTGGLCDCTINTPKALVRVSFEDGERVTEIESRKLSITLRCAYDEWVDVAQWL